MKTGENMSSKVVVGLTLSLLALALAVEAGSMATAQSGNGRSMSQAAAGVFVRPQTQRLTRKTSSTRVDEAAQARRRQARALRQTLVQLEAVPSNSLAECDDWASLNDQYNKLVGLKNRKLRLNEAAKANECNALQLAMSQTRARIGHLRSLFEAERGQVGFVGGLLAEYLDLTHRVAQDETLAKSYLDMVKDEPEIRRGVQNLEQLLEFIRDETRGDDGARGDSLDELSDRVRQLVYREKQLDDEHLRQLNELADVLERTLADQRQVPVDSGRFRYLSGVLDAARAVLVHKLSEQPVDSSDFEASFGTEQSEQQPSAGSSDFETSFATEQSEQQQQPAEQYLEELHEYQEMPQGSYAFAGAYSNHNEQEALEQEAFEREEAQREAAERERAGREEAERLAAAERFRQAYEQPKSARSVMADALAQADRANAEADTIRAARQQASKVVAASAHAVGAAEQQQQAPQQPFVQAMATATSVANGQTFIGQQAQQVRSTGPNSVNDLVSRLRQRQFSAGSNAKAAYKKLD